MLALIEGRLESSWVFTQDKLFVRSLERLPWHYVTAIWGIEKIKELYTPEIANRIQPENKKNHLVYIHTILQREPITPKWGNIQRKIQPSERFYIFEEWALGFDTEVNLKQ
jgi:hypothetical protein